ncbi:MAG: AbrB/MazE/SpoVT family DNA-binding domain-containing protein, partial [Rhodospirillaceae bacterium]|nr:AbrB/MazE/SpoVT family DNA-binding domain-containing protein [Rhodospirillaceae bacterium]
PFRYQLFKEQPKEKPPEFQPLKKPANQSIRARPSFYRYQTKPSTSFFQCHHKTLKSPANTEEPKRRSLMGRVILGTESRAGRSDRHDQATGGFGLPLSVLYSYESRIDRRTVMSAKDTAKLSAKYQISIPKAVRTARHWQAGQEFAFIPKGEGVMLMPIPNRKDLAGLARGATPEDYRDRTDRA